MSAESPAACSIRTSRRCVSRAYGHAPGGREPDLLLENDARRGPGEG
jgi:hypothetical protein